MFHSSGLNNKINSLHERALRITYGDRSSSFQELLIKGNSVSIPYRNIPALAIEMFKVKINIAPEIMKELFAPKMRPYDFRNNNSFKRRRVNCLAWHWVGVLSRSKNMGFSTQWNKRIWISQCFQIQNQKMDPWRISMQNMQNISWANKVYNNVKKLVFSEIKLYVITIVVVSLLLIIVFCLLLNVSWL